MDKLKDLANKVSHSSSGGSSTTNTSGQPAGANAGAAPNTGAAGQKEDYGDKGLDFIEKRTGFSQSRETNEKITDGARDFFEKQTGKDIPDKFSN